MNLATSKFLKYAYFSLRGTQKFLNPEYEILNKKQLHNKGSDFKKYKLSMSYNQIKSKETIFEVDLPARV